MIRTNRLALGLVALALAVATPVVAQDASIAGEWDITIESDQGAFQMTWTLEIAEDGTISGSANSDMGPAEIADGWVDGETFGLTMIADGGGQSMEVIWEGTLSEDEVFGTIDVGGGMFMADFTGMRAEGGR